MGSPMAAAQTLRAPSSRSPLRAHLPCCTASRRLGDIPIPRLWRRARDGDFYGTAYSGGASGHGSVYKITPSGTLTVLYSFSSPVYGILNSDGFAPYAGVTPDQKGNFYGVTSRGGDYGAGTLFRLPLPARFRPSFSLRATVRRLRFCRTDCGQRRRLLRHDRPGGQYGVGSVFSITPTGVYTTLYSLSGADGANPFGSLLQTTTGDLYGVTANGGANNLGVIFHLSPTRSSICSMTSPVKTELRPKFGADPGRNRRLLRDHAGRRSLLRRRNGFRDHSGWIADLPL